VTVQVFGVFQMHSFPAAECAREAAGALVDDNLLGIF